MKSKFYIISMLTLTFILSSCGSMSVSRMRYSRGLNISLFEKKNAAVEERKARVAEKQKTSGNSNVAQNTDSETPVNVAAAQTGFADRNENVFRMQVPTDNSPEISTPVTKKVSVIKTIRQIKHAVYETRYTNQKAPVSFKSGNIMTKAASDSDVAMLLLVLLALLLPPLAVYLYYGSINIQFWISLILTLLAIGAFAGTIYLGWIIPVIHALLVIFGVFG